jgi:hypothetical protein
LDRTGRGDRLQLTETVNLPGVDQWFNVDVVANKGALDNAAKDNPGLYAYRNNAVNVYINGSATSGVCSFPNSDDDIIFLGQNALPTTVIHEIGHFFNLCHTQGCSCNNCATGPGQCDSPGDDEIADTLRDVACWDLNAIAQNNFGSPYASLSAFQQSQVDDVFFNIMSYHGTRDRFTEGQMDRWTEAANGAHGSSVRGKRGSSI